MQVKANDLDMGLDGEIRYQFAEEQQQNSEILRNFAIDSEVKIFLNKLLYLKN